MIITSILLTYLFKQFISSKQLLHPKKLCLFKFSSVLITLVLAISCNDRTGNTTQNTSVVEKTEDQISKIDILVPGKYNSEEYDEATESKSWIALFQQADKSLICKKTEITIEEVNCPIKYKRDQNIGRKISCIPSQSSAMFLVSGLDVINGKTIKCYPNFKSVLLPTEHVTLGKYKIRCQARVGGHSSIWDYKLIISGEKNGQLIEQVFLEKEGFDDAMIQFIWAGDLDEDGIPDLFMDTSHKYSFSNPALFLSSHSDKNKLLKMVSEIKMSRCYLEN